MILCTTDVVSYTSIICMILVYDTFHYDQPKQKPVLVCKSPRALEREKACSSKIKLLLVVRVDATHHSTGPTWLPLNLAERPAVYNIFAATFNIYPSTIYSCLDQMSMQTTITRMTGRARRLL